MCDKCHKTISKTLIDYRDGEVIGVRLCKKCFQEKELNE